MSSRRFLQVDVFTRVPFRGNPVAVVLDAEGLATEEMQRIAAWTNLSETTFVLAPSNAEADYRLRIFTPRAELPFAGHPTLGSAHAVLEAGVAQARDGLLRQECGAGVLELRVEQDRLWLRSPAYRLAPVDGEAHEALQQALGNRISGRPVTVDVGPIWIVADLADAAIVDSLAPALDRIAELSQRFGVTGVTVFGISGDDGSAIHVRAFAPAHGVPEDPVCGSGNISVAAVLAAGGRTTRFGGEYLARQGMALGRDGRVFLRIDEQGILLGGHAVTCLEGALRPE